MTENSDERILRKGFAAYGLALLWLTFSSWGLYRFVMIFPRMLSGAWQPTTLQFLSGIALTLSIGCGFMWATLSLLKQHYVVSLEGIYVARLFGSRFIRWDEVKILNVIPTFAGANNIKLFLNDGKSATLFIAFLAHQTRSAKTIIEAAHFGNSDIAVNFALGNDYGSPPYGIFDTEKEFSE